MIERPGLNRRRFLKYTGATAAVVGASALGLDYLIRNPQISSQQATQPQTLLSSSLATASVSSSSSTQLVSLQGTLFFDYNGNGKQDGGEPGVQNAKVQVVDVMHDLKVVAEASTDSAGDYHVDIPAGTYKLNIQPDSKFRYMCRSPNEVKAVQDGYYLTVIGPGSFLDVGLMEGLLTLPFSSSTKYRIDRFYDHQPAEGAILWWNGINTCPNSFNPDDQYCWSVPPGTDNHPGTDYRMNMKTPILAAAPGLVAHISNDETNIFSIKHPITIGTRPLFTLYSHCSEIEVFEHQNVARGDVIALSGKSGTPYPHLHFALASYSNDPTHDALLDTYKPTVKVPDGFWLSSTGLEPIWTTQFHPANNTNWWTEFDNPHFSD